MLDWTRLVGFDWDAGNERKSADKHGVSQGEAEQPFFNELRCWCSKDDRHSAGERRFHVLGRTNVDRKLHVTFTLRGDETPIQVTQRAT